MSITQANIQFIDDPIYIHGYKNFPWCYYTKEQLYNEYKKISIILINSNITFPIKFQYIGYKCSNIFFQYERMNTKGRGTRDTSIKYWQNNKQHIINMSKKHNLSMFNRINFLNHAPSQFPIIVAAKIYKYFNVKKIFDPYSGWGDRCIAAMALDIDYVGIDSNRNLKNSYKELIKFYPTKSKICINFDYCENIDTTSFDFVLTSPPFWDKRENLLEKYNYTEKNYSNFMNNSLIPIVLKCLNKKAKLCLHLPINMYEDLKNKIGPCDKILEFLTSHCRNGNSYNKIYCW